MLLAGHYFLKNVILLHESSYFGEVSTINWLGIALDVTLEVAILCMKESVRKYIEQTGLSWATRSHNSHQFSWLNIATAIGDNTLNNLASLVIHNDICE